MAKKNKKKKSNNKAEVAKWVAIGALGNASKWCC